ncbi:MAG: chemotaxis protein CheA [Gammaproteobacteria bacterium]|nr:chemotaxis protein CheA [Gammaproteobacteria bacterium]MDH5802334.1 chemotaxis protein CheA [Gammaproteobacteria bacterium]
MEPEESGLQAYINESKELLQDMEDALLQLENSPNDSDLIASIFRVAHTIKGASGIFGFTETETFTHVLENVFDLIRNHELAMDAKLSALMLKSKDHLWNLIVNIGNKEPVSEELMQSGRDLSFALSEYAGIDATFTHEDSLQEVTRAKECVQENRIWYISLRFSTEVLQNGMDPLSFLRYMHRIGDIVGISSILHYEGELEHMDVLSCYTGLEIVFQTAVTQEEIEQVFLFVRNDCQLRILPPNATQSDFKDLIEELRRETPNIETIMVHLGVLHEHIGEHMVEPVARSVSLNEAVEDHQIESTVMAPVRKPVTKGPQSSKPPHSTNSNNPKSKSLRVDADKLDQLINLVGEMVIAGASTNLIAQALNNDRLTESMSVLSRLLEEIRDNALNLRMVQVGETFNRYHRIVRDVSQELGKTIKLEIYGGDTELDKTVIERISDPLIHLIRNSIDHGLESKEERIRLGKSETGIIRLTAYHEAGSIVIEVSDDGRGLDKTKILEKAMNQGLVSHTHILSDSEIYNLVFEPGFSTVDEVTHFSGRGVGMDVVRKNIESLRGSVDIDSYPGTGSITRIRLPLTLAIIDGFLVSVGDSSFVIPLDLINECIESDAIHKELPSYINLRGDVLPLFDLGKQMKIPTDTNSRSNIVVIQFGSVKAGIIVEKLLGEFQTVIKPLGKIFNHLKGVSGATILGTGEVAVILDIPALLSKVTDNVAGSNDYPLAPTNGTLH